MKFLVPNYSCLQNPWLGGCRPQIPVLSVNWIFWTPLPPPNKIPGYATASSYIMHLSSIYFHSNPSQVTWFILLSLTINITYRITDDVCFLRAFTSVPWKVCTTACVSPAHALEKYRDKSMLPHKTHPHAHTHTHEHTHTKRNRTTNVYSHPTSTRPARRYVTKIETRRNKQQNWKGGSRATCNGAFNSAFTAFGAASDIKLCYTIKIKGIQPSFCPSRNKVRTLPIRRVHTHAQSETDIHIEKTCRAFVIPSASMAHFIYDILHRKGWVTLQHKRFGSN